MRVLQTINLIHCLGPQSLQTSLHLVTDRRLLLPESILELAVNEEIEVASGVFEASINRQVHLAVEIVDHPVNLTFKVPPGLIHTLPDQALQVTLLNFHGTIDH